MDVVDAHAHFGHLSEMVSADEAAPPPEDLDRWERDEVAARVESMRRLGIDWAVMQPSHSYLQPEGIRDTMRVNDGMAAYRAKDPQRFPVVLGTVEPLHGARSLDEVDRIKHELRLDGLSWHPRFSGVFLDNRWMRPILRRMADLGLAPFIHTNAESKMEAAWRLQRLADEFPEMTFAGLDAFISYEGTLEGLHLAERTPNIIWIAGPVFSWGMIEAWVRRNGSERIAYGGAASYSRTTPVSRHDLLDQIRRCSLSEEDKANILGGNMRRLFRGPGRR